MKKTLLFILSIVTLVALVVFPGCEGAGPSGENILKIGVLFNFEDDLELDSLHVIEMLAAMDNDNGGVKIGGVNYQIELIENNTGGQQSGEVAAVNKMVFEDKVSFIIGAARYASSWLPTTEENKVIVDICDNNYKEYCDPNLHYVFNGGSVTTPMLVVAGWISENYPDRVESMVISSTDDEFGHIMVDVFGSPWIVFGVEPEAIYYPASATDLSAMATKVMSLNPTAFIGMGYGDVGNARCYKAVAEAGYQGQFIAGAALQTSTLLTILTPAQLEGFLCRAIPTEFDPPVTELSQDFKAAWIDKYGSWEAPNISQSGVYCSLITALQKAGSLDADKVADVLSNGLEYDTPVGPSQMISRPDEGISRTIDSLCAVYIKEIKDGKPTLIATISPSEGLPYFRTAFPAASSSQ